MMEFKINLANIIIRICGIHDTLREYCKEYIITDKNLVEDFSITVTPADIQLERRSEDKEKSDNYMDIFLLRPVEPEKQHMSDSGNNIWDQMLRLLMEISRL